MRFLKLTLRKIISANFTSIFAFFSVKRPGSLSLRPDRCGTDGLTVRLHVRTRATYPHVYEATHVQTGLMGHPDGDPTASIKPGRRISEATPQKSLFWLLVSDFSRVFALSRPLLSFCALLSHSRYSSS